jgi:hypothetical protein
MGIEKFMACQKPGIRDSRRFRLDNPEGGVWSSPYIPLLFVRNRKPGNGPFLYAILPMIDQEHTIMPSQVPPRRKRQGKSPVFSKMGKFLPAIKARYGVKRIGIFGSYARGDETRTSDVDVLVEFAPGQATFDNFMQLAYDLEALFKRKVDLLTVAGIDKYIRSQVEREVIWIEG